MTSTNSHDHYQVLTEEHLEPSNTYKTLFIYSVPLGTIPKS